MGDRAALCEDRIAQIVAADGNPYKVLLVTEAATHAEIKKAYHKTVLLVRECAAIEEPRHVMRTAAEPVFEPCTGRPRQGASGVRRAGNRGICCGRGRV